MMTPSKRSTETTGRALPQPLEVEDGRECSCRPQMGSRTADVGLTATGSEFEPPALAQHPVGRGREPPVGARARPARRRAAPAPRPACARAPGCGSPACPAAGHSGKTTTSPARPAICAEQRIEPVGAVDERHRALWRAPSPGESAPRRRDRPRPRSSPRPCRRRRRTCRGRARERRVRHDMIERRRATAAAADATDRRSSPTRAPPSRSGSRCRRRAGPDRAAFRARRRGHAAPARRGTASPRRAAADIEHQLVRLGRHRGGEKHRIDRDPIAARRLPQPDAAAEQAVLGEGRLGGRGSLTSASSPAVGEQRAGAADSRAPPPSGGAGSRRCCLRRGWCDGRAPGCRSPHPPSSACSPGQADGDRWCAAVPSSRATIRERIDRASDSAALDRSWRHSMLARVRARQADRAATGGTRTCGRIGWRWWRVSIGCTRAESRRSTRCPGCSEAISNASTG